MGYPRSSRARNCDPVPPHGGIGVTEKQRESTRRMEETGKRMHSSRDAHMWGSRRRHTWDVVALNNCICDFNQLELGSRTGQNARHDLRPQNGPMSYPFQNTSATQGYGPVRESNKISHSLFLLCRRVPCPILKAGTIKNGAESKKI